MPAFQLIIGNKNYSSWSLRPWLLLRKLSVSFEETQVLLQTEDFKQQVMRFSPVGKVPVLLDGDLAIWDSLAIAEYLAEQFPQAWPRDVAARAFARSISAEMHSGFMSLRSQMPMNCRATGREVTGNEALAQDIERIQAIWTECRLRYGESGPWLFGEFTIADAMFAPVVFRFNTYGVDCQGFAAEYMQTVLHDADVQAWLHAAQQEQATIMSYEIGLTAQ
ncbi:glutathione S-transferase family protein [uncultured Tolumonas sp.]|uniref:glutathione S-transferase family protein n=1 Tax=uncultured Tolumonas sp. TaxID=263765 RepID=UPI002A0A84EE|nr:glutathione S-transferase family protein [uncultured Tolumonas sp.]